MPDLEDDLKTGRWSRKKMNSYDWDGGIVGNIFSC